MSLNDNHGRSVQQIRFNDTDSYEPRKGNTFTFERDYCGDRDEHWIVERDAEGKEVARHNAKNASSIFFKA